MTFMTGLQCHLCGAKYPAEALWVCDQCLGPLEVVYDYAGVREALTREVIEKRPQNVWRFRELLPIAGEPRTGFHTGCTPLVRARSARAEARPAGAVHQRRLGEPSDAVVQGPRRLDGGDARGRARLQGVRRRLDRQPRQQRVRPCGAPRARVLRVHSARPRAREGPRVRDLPAARRRRARQLRRCEPVVHADRGQVRLGVREHQPPRLLRRRREDRRLRGRRAARLAVPAAPGVAGGRRDAPAEDRARIPRAARDRPGRRGSCRASMPRRRPAARRSFARCTRGSSSPSRSSPRRSPSRSRSATRRTGSRWSRR